MATPALVAAPYGHLNSNLQRMAVMAAVVAIGASGAPTVTFGPEGFSITRTGAGVYTGTVPVGAKGALFVQPIHVESDGTENVELESYSATAGTFSLETQEDTDDAAEDLPDGTVLQFLICVQGG
jgi:hypothetical protein